MYIFTTFFQYFGLCDDVNATTTTNVYWAWFFSSIIGGYLHTKFKVFSISQS